MVEPNEANQYSSFVIVVKDWDKVQELRQHVFDFLQPCMMDDLNEDQNVRHAETLDAAREALIDSVLVIFRGQIETAFREQTAGHNALLLFVTLTLQVMEEQLMNAFHDVTARERGVSPVITVLLLTLSFRIAISLALRYSDQRVVEFWLISGA